ncbi:helix-turn-helix domain-containing protein [Nonomuraea rhizosphaerae]|uniref:helix-turn-helix domain-containing protein n=1 Tax=Nonomuraea rhizosphaerae TaxID=2665663 RepID=UPI001C6035C0|nr:helix-turn-helix transcriptional regulator [Nonomuraea rhizosphaerae]
MTTARGANDLAETGDSRQSGPAVLRMLVGAHLRRLRESRGITREDAGYAIRASHSKIRRLELGRTSFKPYDVADLLTLYGADEAERSAILTLVERAGTPVWWHDYRDVVPDWHESYLGLEQDAALIRTYEIQLIPQLLQTEDYARAVIAQGHESSTSDQVERLVAVRLRRQRLLAEPSARKLWAVMDEAALRRRVGGRAMTRAQLEHLQRMAELPHVTVQVLPFSSGGHVGDVGPVTQLRFAEAELGDVIYLQQIAGAQYLTRKSDVLPYQHLMNKLVLHAQPASATPGIIRQLLSTL